MLRDPGANGVNELHLRRATSSTAQFPRRGWSMSCCCTWRPLLLGSGAHGLASQPLQALADGAQ